MNEISIYNTGFGSNSVYGGFVSVDRLLTQTWNADLWGVRYLEFQADDNGQNTSSKLVETTNGVKPGIAITGVGAMSPSGDVTKFWYTFDPDGERYEVQISDLSYSNALVLPAEAFVIFPSGVEGSIEAYGWDGKNHKAGSFVDITASAESPGQFSANSLNISVTTWNDGGDIMGAGMVMQGSGEADELFGSQFNDFIFDWDGDDRIYAGDGDDIIRSGRGSDYFDGGAPDPNNPGGAGLDTSKNDTFLIDFGFNNGRDYIEVILGDGTYYIDDEGNRTKSDEIRNIEHLQIVSMEGNMLLVGDEEDNIISGSYGNDVLAGEAGDDVLYGGWGDDRFHVKTFSLVGAVRTLLFLVLTEIFIKPQLVILNTPSQMIGLMRTMFMRASIMMLLFMKSVCMTLQTL
jgi:Ca2+-binding RTX toxin-like protein